METALEFDPAIQARWQMLHTDYVAAHRDYLDIKLLRDAADGQAYDPTSLLNAKTHLETAQMALHQFCQTYAEYC